MATADDGPLVDEFGEIDPDEAPSTRRRRRWPIAAAVLAVAVGAGLLVWQPWAGGDSAATTTTAPGLGEEIVIDLPELEFERSVAGSPEMLGGIPGEGFVFAAPDADLDNGPLLAFLVQRDDIDEFDEFDPDGETLEINGQPATVEENGATIEIYWEPAPGVRYGVAGAGMSRARVVAFAEAVSLEGGVTVIDDPTVVDGLEPAGDIATMFAIVAMTEPMFSSAGAEMPPVQEYRSAQGDIVSLASIAAPEQFLAIASLLMDGEEILDVDGSPAIIGAMTTSFADEDGGRRLLLTVRGGRLIGITGELSNDEMLEVLAAVRTATDEEWAVVLAEVVDPFDGFNEGG